MVLKFISFLVYLTVLNNNFLLFTRKNMNINTAFVNNTYPKYNISHISENRNNSISTKPNYLSRKSKFCYIKCDCFFSHTVKNDNICVKDWIRPIGFN